MVTKYKGPEVRYGKVLVSKFAWYRSNLTVFIFRYIGFRHTYKVAVPHIMTHIPLFGFISLLPHVYNLLMLLPHLLDRLILTLPQLRYILCQKNHADCIILSMRSTSHPNIPIPLVKQHPPPLPWCQPIVNQKIRRNLFSRLAFNSYEFSNIAIDIRQPRYLLIDKLRRIMISSIVSSLLISYPLSNAIQSLRRYQSINRFIPAQITPHIVESLNSLKCLNYLLETMQLLLLVQWRHCFVYFVASWFGVGPHLVYVIHKGISKCELLHN